MRKIAWFMFAVVLISCPSVSAQERQYQYPNSLNDTNVGEDCLDYNVDILRLSDNNHRIYWKQHDCIRVHTRNNPFIFKYDISFDEQLIPEDDPLSAFAGKFGLNLGTNATPAPTSNPAGKTRTQSGQSAQKQDTLKVYAQAQDSITKQNPTAFVFRPGGKLAAPGSVDLSKVVQQSKDDFQKNDFAGARSKLEDAERQLGAVRNSQTKGAQQQIDKINEELAKVIASVNKTAEVTAEVTTLDEVDNAISELSTKAGSIHVALGGKQKNYIDYSRRVPPALTQLIDASQDVEKIRQIAVAIRDGAADQLDQLTDHNPTPGDFGSQQDESRFLDFAATAAELHKRLTPATAPSTTRASDQLTQLEQISRRVVYDACAYKAFIDTDVSSIKTGIIDPINAVLSDALAFGYVIPARKREGPWSNPESVTMTVTRTATSVFAATSADGKTPSNTTSSFECSTDTTDLFEFGGSYASFKDFFTDKSVNAQNLAKDPSTASQVKPLPNLYLRNSNSPQTTSVGQPKASAGQPNSGGTQKPASNTNTDNTVFVQPWLFGKARLVLTGGLTEGILRKQEFQRSNSISGTTSPTVIGLKTDTIFRNAPMLYGHVLLGSARHSPDAWYGTFGVTSNSDSKGTDPEFLLGFSRSFAQQRFFLTAGAYVGERQKLDAGLQVGETIPSTLTGDLSVTKSYHVGFGIGISFRLASSKNPQDTTGSKPTTKGTNTKSQGGTQ
jgi:hypothetical protein